MIQAKCIEKFRDKNGNIYGYRLRDINGQTQDVKPENLKQAIKNKQIHVVNLTLTSDNRLVDSSEKQLQSKKLGGAPVNPHLDVEEYMHKLQALLEKYFGTVDCEEPCEKVGENIDFAMPDDALIDCCINSKTARLKLWEDDCEKLTILCNDITDTTIQKAHECIFGRIKNENAFEKVKIADGKIISVSPNPTTSKTDLAKALIILACAIPDPHDKKDMLADVSGLSTNEVNDSTKVLNSIMKDSNAIVKYINNTFSNENLEKDTYALENFESNLKIETIHSKESILNAVKYIDKHKELRVNTQTIIQFMKDCNITSLKTASQILEKLCNKFPAFVSSCTNRHDSFGNVSVHKNAFHFDGIVDFITGYDLSNSDGCNEDIIAIVKNNYRLYLQHLYIDEDTKESTVIKSFEIKNDNTTSLNDILDNFKKYFDESVMNQSNVEEYMSRLQALLERYFGTVDCVDQCEKVGETVNFTMPDEAKIECYINNKKAKFILWEDDYESFIVECEDITENTIEKANECIFNYISGNKNLSKIYIENGNVCKQKTVTKAESNPLDNLFGAGAL